MLELFLTGLVILVVGIVCLLAASIFMAYITQATYVDEGYDDSDD